MCSKRYVCAVALLRGSETLDRSDMDPLYKLLLGETCFTALCTEKGGEGTFLVTRSRPLSSNNSQQQIFSTPRPSGCSRDMNSKVIQISHLHVVQHHLKETINKWLPILLEICLHTFLTKTQVQDAEVTISILYCNRTSFRAISQTRRQSACRAPVQLEHTSHYPSKSRQAAVQSCPSPAQSSSQSHRRASSAGGAAATAPPPNR